MNLAFVKTWSSLQLCCKWWYVHLFVFCSSRAFYNMYIFQGYILCVLDYEFQILDNAFLVHKPGIKTLKKDSARAILAAKTNSLIRKIIFPELKVLFGVRKGCAVWHTYSRPHLQLNWLRYIIIYPVHSYFFKFYWDEISAVFTDELDNL